MVYVVVRTSCDYEGTYYGGIEGVHEDKSEAEVAAYVLEDEAIKNGKDYSYEVEEAEFIERR